MSMFGAPRICRKCINTFLRSGRRRMLRFASIASNHGSFSPTLLARAQLMATEHDTLNARVSESFDAKIAKRIAELSKVASALKEWEASQSSILELQALLEDRTTDAELRELAVEELESTITQVDVLSQNLTASLKPKHPFEDMPCMLEIRPGVGGGEAAIFAGDLLYMYKSYCSRRNLRFSILKYETSNGLSDSNSLGEGPLEEAILEIETAGAYGELRSEAGVHRVQRVPATESKGRTHTSAASVLVLPSFPTSDSEGKQMSEVDLDDPNSDYYVNVSDVRTDVMRARGAGGQHVNTTDSAVRLTHLPTNTVVSVQESRSQHSNREKAWKVLRSRLAQAKREAREEEAFQLRRSVIGVSKMGRGDKVRTYNFNQQRVTDHRSGLSIHNLGNVMEGGPELDKVIDSVKIWLDEMEIRGMLAEEEAASKAK